MPRIRRGTCQGWKWRSLLFCVLLMATAITWMLLRPASEEAIDALARSVALPGGQVVRLPSLPPIPLAQNAVRGALRPTTCRPVRVFDCVSFMNEIEMLEVRLGELWDVVDVFVIVEATMTFQGAPKLAEFADLRQRLPSRFRDARDRLVSYNCGNLAGTISWDREESHRQCMVRALLHFGLAPNDMVGFMDADEIPEARELASLRDVASTTLCRPDGSAGNAADLAAIFPAGIRMQMHYYNFRYVSTAVKWRTDVHIFDGNSSKLKRGVHKSLLTARGWHCSWCFRRVADYQRKFRSFSHTEELTADALTPSFIRNVACTGGELFRTSSSAKKQGIVVLSPEEAVRDAPRYLVAKRQQFKFLLPLDSGCAFDD